MRRDFQKTSKSSLAPMLADLDSIADPEKPNKPNRAHQRPLDRRHGNSTYSKTLPSRVICDKKGLARDILGRAENGMESSTGWSNGLRGEDGMSKM
ncbi:hypothetical protein V490_06202 [Pseudogymnoascus sp. VKM F-3557]|nr:hypothetical protein V490_06202 [Pseudogymnoascus sp. VKM F-3557]